MVAVDKEFRVCADFSRGQCTREKCTYVHNVNKEAARDAEICADYSRGKCNRPFCRFIHNENRDALITTRARRASSPQRPPVHPPAHSAPLISRYEAPPPRYEAPPPRYEAPPPRYETAAPARREYYDREYRDPLPRSVEYIPEHVLTRTSVSSNPYLQSSSSSSAARVENNPYLLAAKLSVAAASYPSYAAQQELPPPRALPPPPPAAAVRRPTTCGRRTCSYVHNINEHARKDGPCCRDFTATGACVNLRCPEAHNVNTNPPRDNAPYCGDFASILRKFYEDNPSVMPPREMPLLQVAPHPLAAASATLPAALSLLSYAAPIRIAEDHYHSRVREPDRERDHRDNSQFNWCIDFDRGNCKRENCTYVHNVNPRANRDTHEVCGDFFAGRCKRETCKYIHNSNPHAKIVKSVKRARYD